MHVAMTREYCKGLSRGINEVAQQDGAYTAPENHHVNDAGEKIACRVVDIYKS